MSTKPTNAVARTSIACQRSSRPGPPRPASVSLRRPKRNTNPSAVMTARPPSPWSRWSPIQEAARMSRPRKTQKPGIHQRLRQNGLVLVDMEHLLYGRAEEARQHDRQGQRGRVALLLDGVDRLARDIHRLRQLLL